MASIIIEKKLGNSRFRIINPLLISRILIELDGPLQDLSSTLKISLLVITPKQDHTFTTPLLSISFSYVVLYAILLQKYLPIDYLTWWAEV